jgi:CTP synthase (UTP-ammonia lyase)
MHRSAWCLVIPAVLVGFFVLPPAHAGSEGPQCPPGGCGTQLLTAWDRQYIPGCGPPPSGAILPGDKDECRNVVIRYGDKLEFFNTDAPGTLGEAGHHVTEVNPHGPPRFDSGLVPFGTKAEVVGVSKLVLGRYFFSCQIHPEMKGKIHVVPGAFGPG